MFIQELAQRTGVPAKTIRYYESIGLLPNPQRGLNNYRQYAPEAGERLRFIVSARSLGFTLADIGEFLAARDKDALPCKRIMDSLDQRISEIDRHIADLLALRETLTRICTDGAGIPAGQKCDEECNCYLVTDQQEQTNVK